MQAKASASTFFTGVSLITGGASHTLASKTDGTLWSWGLNTTNQLGDGTATQRVFPVQVKDTSGLAISGIMDFSGGTGHGLATKSDGTAWGWGLNSLGQTGSYPGTNTTTAVQITVNSVPVITIVALGDPDGDTLPTWKERELGTNPILADTDTDGIPDNYEVSHNLNPLINDANADPDHDLFTNFQEFVANTNPQNPDTDGDTVLDGEDIYPLDLHFTLKRTPEYTYAVVEIVNDVSFSSLKMNGFNTVVFSKDVMGPEPMTRAQSWVYYGTARRYLFALDDPSLVAPPDDTFDVFYMHAAGINDSGQVVGASSYQYPPNSNARHYNQTFGGGNVWHAFRGSSRLPTNLWDGCVDNLVNDTTGAPTIDGTNKGQAEAFAINNSGLVVGRSDFWVDVDPPEINVHDDYLVHSSVSHAASFHGNSTATDLGGLPGGGPSIALAANDNGDIAGYGWDGASGQDRAILWTGGQILNLGSIPGFPYAGRTYALGINIGKYVVGALEYSSLPVHYAPFVWHDGEMRALPIPDGSDAQARAINKDGVMVGGWLWRNGAFENLNDYRGASAITAGWTFGGAYDINDNGVILAKASRTGFSGYVLLIPEPAVQLITPSGDSINAPVDTIGDGQNEFTFSSANPGVLSIHLKAKVLATGTAGSLAPRCRFTVDAIGGSTMAWNASNPNGQPTNTSGDYLEADVTFTGLPANNTDFGRKKVAITVDGGVRDQKAMEVFFPRDQNNHPGVDNGITPNWYYYWLQTVSLLGPNPRVSYSPTGGSAYNPNVNSFTLSDGDRLSYTAPYGQNNPVEGIDDFAWTAIHESQHYADWVTLWDIDYSGVSKHQAAIGGSGPADDKDGDRISNLIEDVNLNGLYDAGDLYDWQVNNTPTAGRPLAIVNDFEDWNCQRHTDAKGDHSQDWAHPGMQHLTLDNYND